MELDNIGADVNKTPNSDKTVKLDDTKATETQADTSNELNSTSEQSEDTQGTATDGVTKHVVSYIGGGIWVDQSGEKWARDDVPGTDIKSAREYTDDKYQTRDDIKFMVAYGAMKLVTVTL
jgi:hypothetical protein